MFVFPLLGEDGRLIKGGKTTPLFGYIKAHATGARLIVVDPHRGQEIGVLLGDVKKSKCKKSIFYNELRLFCESLRLPLGGAFRFARGHNTARATLRGILPDWPTR